MHREHSLVMESLCGGNFSDSLRCISTSGMFLSSRAESCWCTSAVCLLAAAPALSCGHNLQTLLASCIGRIMFPGYHKVHSCFLVFE